MSAFDPTDLSIRLVSTPDGDGEIIGVDNKEHPAKWIVSVRVDGMKLRVAKEYSSDELEEK